MPTIPGKLLVGALQNADRRGHGSPRRRAARSTKPRCAFFFDALHFVALAERFGAHSLFDVTLTRGPSRAARTAPRSACATWCRRRSSRRASRPRAPRRCSPARSRRITSIATRWACPHDPVARRRLAVSRRAAAGARGRRRLDALARPRAFAGADRRADRAAVRARSRATTWPSSAASSTCSRWSTLMRERHPDVPVWAQSRGMDEAGARRVSRALRDRRTRASASRCWAARFRRRHRPARRAADRRLHRHARACRR